MLKLLNFSCSRCSFPSDHSDHFLVNINTKLMPKGSGVPLEVRMHGRKGSERLLRRREEMLERGMPQAKANAATAAELVRWLWALGMMCREAGE